MGKILAAEQKPFQYYHHKSRLLPLVSDLTPVKGEWSGQSGGGGAGMFFQQRSRLVGRGDRKRGVFFFFLPIAEGFRSKGDISASLSEGVFLGGYQGGEGREGREGTRRSYG